MRNMIDGPEGAIGYLQRVSPLCRESAVLAPRRVPLPAAGYRSEFPWSRTQERYASTAVGSVGKIRSSPTDAVRP